MRAEGYVFQIEVTYRAILAGFRVREVPIVFVDRAAGLARCRGEIALEAMLLVPAASGAYAKRPELTPSVDRVSADIRAVSGS